MNATKIKDRDAALRVVTEAAAGVERAMHMFTEALTDAVEIITLGADTAIAGGEMAADVAAYDAAKAEGGAAIPTEVIERLIAGENALKVFREWRGLKQKELAPAVHSTAAYLSQLERGHRGASINLLRRIADELEVDFTLLID